MGREHSGESILHRLWIGYMVIQRLGNLSTVEAESGRK